MKRILLLTSALLCFITASAQYATVPQGQLTHRGAKVFSDGQRLTPDQAVLLFSDMGGLDRSGDYLNYRKGYRTGAGLMIGGASAMVLGSITFTGFAITALIVGLPLSFAGKEIPVGIDIGLYSGFVIASAGFASLIAGIPVLCINKDRMRGLVNDYNAGSSAQDLSLNFGPAPSGVGFTLNF